MPGHEAVYLRTKCSEMRVLMLGGFLMTSGFNIEWSRKVLRYSQNPIPLPCYSRK